MYIGKVEALNRLAQWVALEDDKEYEDYTYMCDFEGLDPSDLQGKEQQKHPYALALIGLELEYPKEGK